MNKNKLAAMWQRVLRSLTIAMCELQIRRLEEAAARARRYSKDTFLHCSASKAARLSALNAWADAGALTAQADRYRDRLREVLHATV